MSRKPTGTKHRVFPRRIQRLEQEIRQLDESFYIRAENENSEAYYYSLEIKRENSVRAIVLQLHLAIEDLLDSLLKNHLLKNKKSPARGKRAVQRLLEKTLDNLNYPTKLTLMRALDIVSEPLYQKLLVLNHIRNRCSHDWMLNPRYRKKETKRPSLTFKNRSLWEIDVMREFIDEYGKIYLDLFMQT